MTLTRRDEPSPHEQWVRRQIASERRLVGFLRVLAVVFTLLTLVLVYESVYLAATAMIIGDFTTMVVGVSRADRINVLYSEIRMTRAITRMTARVESITVSARDPDRWLQDLNSLVARDKRV